MKEFVYCDCKERVYKSETAHNIFTDIFNLQWFINISEWKNVLLQILIPGSDVFESEFKLLNRT